MPPISPPWPHPAVGSGPRSAASLQTVTALLIGDDLGYELTAAVNWLQQQCKLVVCHDIGDAVGQIDEGCEPQLVVLAQRRPGQHADADVVRLRRRVPLARLVALLGVWCEGETRTGRPWPGVLRLYWHQFTARALADDWQQTPLQGWLAQPLTTTLAERELVGDRFQALQQATIAVSTGTATTFHGLADVIRSAGARAVWVREKTHNVHAPRDRNKLQADRPDEVRSVIWDVPSLEPQPDSVLDQLVAAYPGRRMVALANFPRQSQIQRWQRQGMVEVLAKPFFTDELLARLAVAVGPAEGAIKVA